MAYEFKYITGSKVPELQALVDTYISNGYEVVGSIYDMMGTYIQGVEKNTSVNITEYVGVLSSYNYSDGINRGNNKKLLSKSFRRKNGIIGNEITSSMLTSDEINTYYGL